MVDHTKEPWIWHAQGDANQYCLLASGDKWVIAFSQNGELHTHEQIANARRIVACVNACASIPTYQLHGEIEEANDLGAMIDKLRQERDELAAMVEVMRMRDEEHDSLVGQLELEIEQLHEKLEFAYL